MEKILSFILNERNINLLFIWIAILFPVISIVTGAVLGAVKKDYRFYLTWGVAIGAFGPLNILLWTLYNVVTEHYGLDTVKNLVVNVIIFIVIGIILGFLISFLPRKDKKTPGVSEKQPTETEDAEEP